MGGAYVYEKCINNLYFVLSARIFDEDCDSQDTRIVVCCILCFKLFFLCVYDDCLFVCLFVCFSY